MSPEDRLLCACTKAFFNEDDRFRICRLVADHKYDWQIVFDTAESQRVSPLIYHNLTQIGLDELAVPPSIQRELKTAYIHNVIKKQRTRAHFNRVLDMLLGAGLDVLLVKGEAINRFIYPHPWFTISDDVDVVIRGKRRDLLNGPHAALFAEVDELNEARSRFEQHVEFDFDMHHDISMNGVLTVDPDYLWASAQAVELDGRTIYRLPAEMMLLTAAISACRKRFSRLKVLLDFVTVAEKYPDLDWGVVVDDARAFGADNILYSALRVTEATLAFQAPPTVYDDLAINPMRRRTIDALVRWFQQYASLSTLASRSGATLLSRDVSWSLLLTYGTYRLDQLGPKFMELLSAWRNPHPAIPAPVK